MSIDWLTFTFRYTFVVDEQMKLSTFYELPGGKIEKEVSQLMFGSVKLRMVDSMFAVDHGNVTKLFVFDESDGVIAFGFYGAEKKPVVEMAAYNSGASYPILRKPSLIKGGQAIASIDEVRSELLILNICSHSEYLDFMKVQTTCSPCPANHYSTLAGTTRCNSCADTGRNDAILKELCSNTEMYKPFNTRFQLADFSDLAKNRVDGAALFLLVGMLVLCCLTFAVFFGIFFCRKLNKSSRNVQSEVQMNAGQDADRSAAIRRTKGYQMQQFLDDIHANLTKEKYKFEGLNPFAVHTAAKEDQVEFPEQVAPMEADSALQDASHNYSLSK